MEHGHQQNLGPWLWIRTTVCRHMELQKYEEHLTSMYPSTADRYVVPTVLSTRCNAAQWRLPALLRPRQPVETAVPCLQLSRKQTTVALGPFGPEDPHQHDMSHANKLAQLAYSKRAHSEWSLLQNWEADVEKLSIQERKELLAKLKVHSCLCSVPYCEHMMSGVHSMPVMHSI